MSSVLLLLDVAVPAELWVPAEISECRPVIPHGEDLSRQTRVTPRSVASNGKTCRLSPLHNGRNGKKHWLYIASSRLLGKYSYSTLKSRGSRVEDKVMDGQGGSVVNGRRWAGQPTQGCWMGGWDVWQ